MDWYFTKLLREKFENLNQKYIKMSFNPGNYFLFQGYSIGENKLQFDNELVRFICTNNTYPTTFSLLVIASNEEIDVANCTGKDVLLTEKHCSLFGIQRNLLGETVKSYSNGFSIKHSLSSDDVYVNSLLQRDAIKKISQKEKDRIVLEGLI
jgi:hypothetical protein